MKKKLKSLFMKKEGGKDRVILKALGFFFGVLFLLLLIFLLFTERKDTSYIVETDKPLETPKGWQRAKDQDLSAYFVQGGLQKKKHKNSGHQRGIKYSAKQVILRRDSRQVDSLPIGTNLIGQLLTAIDTRDARQVVKVILPYGGLFKRKRILARNTLLLGPIQYQGKGEKVFVTFHKGVLPNGREFALKAQALRTKDYSTGLMGDYHSQTDLRLLGAMGVSMLSKASDVLTEREALAEGISPTPKANMRNAVLQGLSKGLEMEGSRQMGEMQNQKGYVTIDAGEDLIVNLLAPLSLEELENRSLE